MDEFCPDNCEFLSCNEEEQNKMYKISGLKHSHHCNKYYTRLIHGHSHPRIRKCASCMGLSSPIRITRENMFKQIVEITAQRSSCVRKQVGAILVKDNRIISQGYNGPAAGINCPVCEGPGCSKAIHAEINAIVFAARAGVSIEGSDLYITLSPCVNCAKAIINSGIKNVYFIEKYRDTAGIDLLISAHINCQELIE